MPILHLQFVSQVLHRDACTSWRKLRPNPVFSKAVGGMRIRAVGGATYSVRAAEVAFDLINRKPLVKTHRHSPGETALSRSGAPAFRPIYWNAMRVTKASVQSLQFTSAHLLTRA